MRAAIGELLLFGDRPAARLLVSDSFTDADNSLATHLPDINTTGTFTHWSTGNGTADIIGNKLQATTNAGCAVASMGVTDVYMKFDSMLGSSSSSLGCGFYFRLVDASNRWFAGYGNSNLIAAIIERVAGVSTTRASASGASHSTVVTSAECTVQGANVTWTNLTNGLSVSYSNVVSFATSTTHGPVVGNTTTVLDNFVAYTSKP